MKSIIFIGLLLIFNFYSNQLFSQKNDDNLIVVTVSDTTKIYERVRQAITFTNLIIREDSKKDTLVTLSEVIDGSTIYLIAVVIITGNKVEISGAYGLGKDDYWGFPSVLPKSYKPVVYFKGSQGWKVIRQIAIKLDGKIEYINTSKKS